MSGEADAFAVPAMLNVALLPLQIVVVPLITPVGRALTVTTTLPVLSPDAAVQFASSKVEIVYVVFDDGLTETVIGLVLPLKLAPLDNVPFHGDVPVTTMLNVALAPLQIVVVPVISPVGVCTVTTTGFISEHVVAEVPFI